MVFQDARWDELIGQGYTVVSGAIDARNLRAAQGATDHLFSVFPEGWERSKNELWREIKDSTHPAFLAIAANTLDPLAGEILETVHAPDRIQFSQTLPGFSTAGIVGRHFHIDGGLGPSLAAFNVLFGVALTDVTSDTVGGFHVLPGSHEQFASFFREQLGDRQVHWGEAKQVAQKKFLTETRMVVPRLQAGDIFVAHSFLAHGTSHNTTGGRRDMIFQRRAAVPLSDPATQAVAREAFMRNPW